MHLKETTMAEDKQKHLIYGFIIAMLFGMISPIFGLGIALLAGVLKELYGMTGRGTPDIMDVTYTALGGICGFVCTTSILGMISLLVLVVK